MFLKRSSVGETSGQLGLLLSRLLLARLASFSPSSAWLPHQLDTPQHTCANVHTCALTHVHAPCSLWLGEGLNLRLIGCHGNCQLLFLSAVVMVGEEGREFQSLMGEGERHPSGCRSPGWVPAFAEVLLRVTNLFLLPHPCTISGTSGPEETGRRTPTPVPRSLLLMGNHSPLPNKQLIGMKKTP